MIALCQVFLPIKLPSVSRTALLQNILHGVTNFRLQTSSYFSACGISSANICRFLFNTEKAEQTLYFWYFNVAIKLKTFFLPCVFVQCKERKPCLNTACTQIRNHYFIIYARMAKERKTAKFDLQLGAIVERERDGEKDIWIYGITDKVIVFFYIPWTTQRTEEAEQIFYLNIFYKLRRERWNI